MELLLVGFGGFLGAIARYLVYLVESTFRPHSFPAGTMFINLSGCLLAGLLLAVAEKAQPGQRPLLVLSTIGFVGSFTTFSTLSVESFQLIRSNQMWLAFLNIGISSTLGLAAVWLGRFLVLKN